MAGTYGGLPQVTAGISWALGNRSRFFLATGYGRRNGDPYWDINYFDTDQDIELQTVPFFMGLKFNASANKEFRLYFGAAAQMTYAKETIQTGIINGEPTFITPSGLLTGYYLFVGPEFPLGEGSDSLGMEFGFGGTKGSVDTDGHGHDVDLTGYHLRIVYSLGL